METQREDGKPYPPASLRCLLSALNRILQDNKAPFSVFDKKDPQFRDLMRTLDTVSSELHCEGIGAQHKSASVRMKMCYGKGGCLEMIHHEYYSTLCWDAILLNGYPGAV